MTTPQETPQQGDSLASVRSWYQHPEGDLPGSQTHRAAADQDGDHFTWQVTRVDDHPVDGTYVQLVAGPAAELIADPIILRSLAQVLLTQARLVEIEDPNHSAAGAAALDIETLLAAWEGLEDSWDLVGGVVIAQRLLTDRLRAFAIDLTGAIDGDETLADIWELESMAGQTRDEDIANALEVQTGTLLEALTYWSSLPADPSQARRRGTRRKN